MIQRKVVMLHSLGSCGHAAFKKTNKLKTRPKYPFSARIQILCPHPIHTVLFQGVMGGWSEFCMPFSGKILQTGQMVHKLGIYLKLSFLYETKTRLKFPFSARIQLLCPHPIHTVLFQGVMGGWSELSMPFSLKILQTGQTVHKLCIYLECSLLYRYHLQDS